MKYRLADPMIDENQLKLVQEVFSSKALVHGEYCEKFEENLGAYLGVNKECVAVTSSGTASLHLALLALGIQDGDGVLVPNFTFPATVNVVERVGATPIFVDVDSEFYVIDPHQMEKIYNEKKDEINIKAVIVVHEFGASADMDTICLFAKKNNLFVIEDAACALGTEYNNHKVGLLSDVGCFSFHPRKAITTGEGGAIVSRNSMIIEKCKIFRNHGMQKKNGIIDFVAAGLNYRMTNFQAVLGIEQLKHFDSWIEQRRALQLVYRKMITSNLVIHPKSQLGHTWQSYMIVLTKHTDRDKIIEGLKDLGIESNYGAYDVLSTEYYSKKYFEQNNGRTKNSQILFRQGLCLPLHQGLTVEDITHISLTLNHLLEE